MHTQLRTFDRVPSNARAIRGQPASVTASVADKLEGGHRKILSRLSDHAVNPVGGNLISGSTRFKLREASQSSKRDWFGQSGDEQSVKWRQFWRPNNSMQPTALRAATDG